MASKEYYIEESNIIQKYPNSEMAPFGTGQKAPSCDAQPNSVTSAIAPHLQATSTSVACVSSTHAVFGSAQAEVSSGKLVDDKASLSSNPTCSASNMNTILFDKELPPKPTLWHVKSSERRGIYDAFDSDPENVRCAPLQPNTPIAASPSLTGSDGRKISPSLRSDPYNSPKIAVGTTVNARKASVNPIAVFPKNSSALRDAYDQSFPRFVPTQRHLPTSGHITALRIGNPVSKRTPQSRFSSNTYQCGSRKQIERHQSEINREPESRVMANVSDAGYVGSSGFSSRQHLDDLTRRSVKYGLGATIRSSHDAREIIMGETQSFSGMSNNSADDSLSGQPTTTGDSPKVLLNPEAREDRETQTCFARRFPPRLSSLPRSTHDIVKKPSATSRLARPTKASSARAAANTSLRNSGTMTSVKKFGSRLSSIMPGRRHSDFPSSLTESKHLAGVNERDATGVCFETVKADNSTNVHYASSINGRAFLTTYEDRDMALSCSELVRAGSDGALIVKPTNRVDLQQSQRDRHECQAATFHASEVHMRTNTDVRCRARIQQHGSRQDEDDEPPTQPPTRDGSQDHYTEEKRMDDQQEIHREFLSLHDTVVNSLLPASNDHFNQMIKQAESTLQILIATAGGVRDPKDRKTTLLMVQALGESMLAANRAAAAIISFRDANERLLAVTISFGQYATSIARDIQRDGNQQL